MFKIVGFEKQLNQLIEKYDNKKLHNSIILYGPKGIGKRTFINLFLYQLIKKHFDQNEFNHHLNLFKNNIHPNIKIIMKEIDEKSKKLKSYITIDQIRNIKNFINSTSIIDTFDKFIIIDTADDLNINSANSFLKTLEEPKRNIFIFLITNQLSSLLPTLRSRCLKVKFNSHSLPNFKNILLNNISDIGDDEINFLYDITYGSPGIALSVYDENILDLFDLTLSNLKNSKNSNNIIQLSNLVSNLDNNQFMNYLLILKTILILLKKIKLTNFELNMNSSLKFKEIKKISSILTIKNVVDRFDFLVKNENNLVKYNLDKKLFILNFFTN